MYLEARRRISSKLDLIVFGGSRLEDEDVSRGKKMYCEQTCAVYLIVRPSVGRGLRLEDVSRGKKLCFEQTCVVYLISFGGSRVKTRRCISRQEDVFEQTCVVYLIVRPSVGRGLRLEDVSRGKKMYC